jgi:hypothetical protein
MGESIAFSRRRQLTVGGCSGSAGATSAEDKPSPSCCRRYRAVRRSTFHEPNEPIAWPAQVLGRPGQDIVLLGEQHNLPVTAELEQQFEDGYRPPGIGLNCDVVR